MRAKDFQYFFSGFVPFDNKLLIISYENFLLEFNLADSTMQFAQKMNTEICGELYPYHVEQFVQVGNSLVAISMWGQNAYIYDFEEDRWRELEIGCQEKEWGNFLGVFGRKEYLYVMPKYREHIIKIDTREKNIFRLKNPLISQLDIENVIVCSKGDFVYFFDSTSNRVFISDLINTDYKCVGIKGTLGKIVAVQYHKNCFFLLSETGKTVVWREQDNILETIIDPIDGLQSNCFGQAAVTDENIWLLPALGKDIYIYDFRNKSLGVYTDYPKELSYLNFENYYKYLPGKKYKDKIYFGMHSANHILCIDANTGKEKWFYPKLPPMGQADAFRRRHGLSVQESETEISLSGFLHDILQMEEDGAAYVWKRKMIGSAIWKTVKV